MARQVVALVQIQTLQAKRSGKTSEVPQAGFEDYEAAQIAYVALPGDKGTWIRPSLSILENALLFSTSTEWVKSVISGAAEKGVVRSAREQLAAAIGGVGDVNGVVFVDVDRVIAAIEANRAKIEAGKDPAELEVGLSILKLAKAFVITARQTPQQTRIRASLHLN